MYTAPPPPYPSLRQQCALHLIKPQSTFPYHLSPRAEIIHLHWAACAPPTLPDPTPPLPPPVLSLPPSATAFSASEKSSHHIVSWVQDAPPRGAALCAVVSCQPREMVWWPVHPHNPIYDSVLIGAFCSSSRLAGRGGSGRAYGRREAPTPTDTQTRETIVWERAAPVT